MKKGLIAVAALIIIAVIAFMAIPKAKPVQEGLTPDKTEALIASALLYQDSMDTYFDTDLGKKEWALKRNLREAYLKCDGSHEEIVAYVDGYGRELDRKLKEWNLKVEKGILERGDAGLSIEDFAGKAQDFLTVYNQASMLPEFEVYDDAHKAFKSDVTGLMTRGVAEDDIVEALEDGGISSKRVLAMVHYWRVKEL